MADILELLRSENEDVEWCGPNGLFQRGAKEIERLRAALDEVQELIGGYVDIRDGDNGPMPNDAMRAVQVIDAALMREIEAPGGD